MYGKKLKNKIIEIYSKEIKLKSQRVKPDSNNSVIKTHYFSKSKILMDWAFKSKFWIFHRFINLLNFIFSAKCPTKLLLVQ